MDSPMLHYISLAITLATILFAAGGFYYYVPNELRRLREDMVAQRDQLSKDLTQQSAGQTEDLHRIEKDIEEKAKDIHDNLNQKVDKNYEVLERKIDRNEAACKADLSGIGGKVSRIDKDAQKRHHNITQVLMLVAPAEKEERVTVLLKEEVS